MIFPLASQHDADFWQTLFGGGLFMASVLAVQPAAADTLFQRAENQVPVAIVEIKRPAEHTEIHLQAQAALAKVCFAASGPTAPIFSPPAATIAISVGTMSRRALIDATKLRATSWCYASSRWWWVRARFRSCWVRVERSNRSMSSPRPRRTGIFYV
jgi:hypothetical protein